MKWFRFYSEALDDPKVQRLEPVAFKLWVNLLCLSNEGTPRGRLPEKASDIAYRLRISESKAVKVLDELVFRGLLDRIDDQLVPHNWDARHRVRCSSAEWVALRDRVFERDDYTCQYCGARGGRLECDHVVPYSRGGPSEVANLVTACFPCNRSKRDKLLSEWQSVG